MKKKFFFAVMLLLVAAFPLSAQIDCYSSTRRHGVSLMEKGHYSEAIQVFQSAQTCPDMPAGNDLESLMAECRKRITLHQDELKAQAEERRKRRVAAERREAENERRLEIEREAKGYMDVLGLEFANVTMDGDFLTESGALLYESDIRFIQPILTYRGLSREPKNVELFVKFITPDGTLLAGPSSPEGFSLSHVITVSRGRNRANIRGWGRRDESLFVPGTHKCEIWYKDKLLVSESFRVLADRGSRSEGLFEITGISFANTTFNNEVLSAYGSPLVSEDLRFLKSKIRYRSDRDRKMDLTIKMYDPDGSLFVDDTDTYSVHSGAGQELSLSGLGAKSRSIYAPGTYRYEIWDNGNRLFSRIFRVENSAWREAMDGVMERGAERLSSGSLYRGELVVVDNEPIREGLGVFSWSDGPYYWGEWSAGKCDGEGIFIASSTENVGQCPGCVFYVGSFVGNAKSGMGRCYDADGNLIYEGMFSDNAPTGTYPSAGQPNLRFEFRETEGDCYIGETKDGKRHGKGILISKSGDAWYGDWFDGAKLGEGLPISQ